MKNLRVARLTVGSLVLAGLSRGTPSAFGWQGQLVPGSQTSTRQEAQKDLARLERNRFSDRPHASHPANGIGRKVAAASASRTVSASGEVFFTSSFADHVTEGDVTGGEDPVVRQAAVADHDCRACPVEYLNCFLARPYPVQFPLARADDSQ